MSVGLDRWCARLAAVYPDRGRAAEVASTLAESNDGRSRPRLGDAVDVLRHGFVARLGGRATNRAGRWADAASVAVVLALLVQAATAVAIVARTYLAEPAFLLWDRVHWWDRYAPFSDPHAARLALGVAVVAVAAATAACLGQVRATRVLAAVAAAGGLAAFPLASVYGHGVAYRFGTGAFVVGFVVVVVAAVQFTGAVARATEAVPGVLWVFAAQAAFAGAFAAMAVAHGYATPAWYTSLVALPAAAYAAAALAVGVVALVAARRTPVVAGGAALVMLVAIPCAVPVDQFSGTHYGGLYVVLSVLPVAALGLRARRGRRSAGPAEETIA